MVRKTNNDLENSKLKIDELYNNGNYEEFVDFATKVLFKNTHNNELFGYFFSTLVKCLEVEAKHIKKAKYRSHILNAMGLLCYHNFKFELAINFYFIAFIRLESKKHFFYFHNLADSLSELGDYETALIYFNKAIELLAKYQTVTAAKYKNKLNLYRLDKVQCLFNSGKIEEAIQIFNTLDEAHISQPFGINYFFVDTLLGFYSLDYNEFLDKFNKTKAYYLQKNSTRYILKLNNFLLKSSTKLSTQETENLLVENVTLSLNALNENIEKKALTEIITFYKKENNYKKVSEYLELMFERLKASNKQYDTQLLNLYLEEVSEIFNEQKNINLEITNKKEELENITHILSHDLKTPLRTIRSFAGLLKKDIEKEKYSRLNSHLSYIRKSSENLYKLIEDVSLMNKLERNINELEVVDLNEVISAVSISLDYLIYKKNAKIISCNNPPQIRANYSAISIFFQNIIQNGIKYNNSNKPIVKISYILTKQDLLITFTDNGIGISEEYFEQVFIFFKRLHTEDEYDGTGFGLGICKKIINSYRGTISVQSQKGKGSTFTVSLPISILA